MGYGAIGLNKIGDYGLYNSSTGYIELNGYSNIEAFKSEIAKSDLFNDGISSTFICQRIR